MKEDLVEQIAALSQKNQKLFQRVANSPNLKSPTQKRNEPDVYSNQSPKLNQNNIPKQKFKQNIENLNQISQNNKLITNTNNRNDDISNELHNIQQEEHSEFYKSKESELSFPISPENSNNSEILQSNEDLVEIEIEDQLPASKIYNVLQINEEMNSNASKNDNFNEIQLSQSDEYVNQNIPHQNEFIDNINEQYINSNQEKNDSNQIIKQDVLFENNKIENNNFRPSSIQIPINQEILHTYPDNNEQFYQNQPGSLSKSINQFQNEESFDKGSSLQFRRNEFQISQDLNYHRQIPPLSNLHIDSFPHSQSRISSPISTSPRNTLSFTPSYSPLSHRTQFHPTNHEIEILSMKIKSLEEKNSQLSQDLTEEQERTFSKSEKYKSLKREYLQLNESSEKKLKSSEKNYKDIRQRLLDSEDRARSLETTHHLLEEENSILKQQVENLKFIVEEKDKLLQGNKILELEEEIEKLNTQYIEEIKSLNDKFKWYIDTHKKLKEENNSLRLIIENKSVNPSFNDSQNMLIEENESLHQELSLLKESFQKIQNTKKNMNLDSLSPIHQTSTQEFSLKEQEEQSSAKVKYNNNSNESSQFNDSLNINDFKSLQEELNRILEKYTSAIEEKSDLKIQLERNSLEVSTLKEKLKLNSKNFLQTNDEKLTKTLKNEIEGQKKLYKQALHKIERLSRQLDIFSENTANRRVDIGKLDGMPFKELNLLRKQNDELARELDESKDMIENLQDQIVAHEHKNNKILRKYGRLKSIGKEQENYINKIKSKLKSKGTVQATQTNYSFESMASHEREYKDQQKHGHISQENYKSLIEENLNLKNSLKSLEDHNKNKIDFNEEKLKILSDNKRFQNYISLLEEKLQKANSEINNREILVDSLKSQLNQNLKVHEATKHELNLLDQTSKKLETIYDIPSQETQKSHKLSTMNTSSTEKIDENESKLHSLIKEFNNKIIEKDELIEQSKNELLQSQLSLKSMKEEYESLKKKNFQLEDLVEQFKSLRSKTNETIEENNKYNLEIEDENTKEKLKDEIKNTKDTNDDLEEIISIQNDKIKELENIILSLTQSKNEIFDKLEFAQKNNIETIDRLQYELNEKQTQIEHMNSKYETENNNKEKLEDEILQLQLEKDKIVQEAKNYETSIIEDYSKKIDIFTSENNLLKETIQSLQLKIKEKENLEQELNNKVQDALSDQYSLQNDMKRIGELEQEIVILKELHENSIKKSNEKINEEKMNHSIEINNLNAQINLLKDELILIQKHHELQVENLINQKNEFMLTVALACGENVENKSDLLTLEFELQSLKKKIEEKNKRFNTKLDELTKELDESKRNLEEQKSKYSLKKKKLSEMKKENLILENKIKSLEQDLLQTNEKNTQQIRENLFKYEAISIQNQLLREENFNIHQKNERIKQLESDLEILSNRELKLKDEIINLTQVLEMKNKEIKFNDIYKSNDNNIETIKIQVDKIDTNYDPTQKIVEKNQMNDKLNESGSEMSHDLSVEMDISDVVSITSSNYEIQSILSDNSDTSIRKKNIKKKVNPIQGVAISPDGDIYIITTKNIISIYDVVTRSLIKKLDSKSKLANKVAFSPDGKFFAVSGEGPGSTVSIWTKDGIAILRYSNRTSVSSLGFNPRNKSLISGTEIDFGIFTIGKKNVLKFPVNSGILSHTWNQDGTLLAFTHLNGDIAIRDAAKLDSKSGEIAHQVITIFNIFPEHGNSIQWIPKSNYLEENIVIGGSNRNLYFLNYWNSKLSQTNKIDIGFIPKIILLIKQGEFLCVTGDHFKCCLFNNHGIIMRNIISSISEINSISIHKNQLIVSNEDDLEFIDMDKIIESILCTKLNQYQKENFLTDCVIQFSIQ